MSAHELPEAAVEAAARAIAGRHWQTAMDDARAALTAALPHLASTVPDRDSIARAISTAIETAYTFEGDLDPQVDAIVTDAVLAVLPGPTVAGARAQALNDAADYIERSRYGAPLPVSQVLSILRARANQERSR